MIRVFKWKYAVGDRVESSQYGSIFTIYLNYSKDGEHYYDVVRDGKMFTFKKHMFENSTEKVLVEDEGGATLKWKFKKGDVIKDKECEYTVVGDCVEYGIEMYILRNKYGETIKPRKIIVDQVSELVKPKSLYEQALELIGIGIEQEFIFTFKNSYGSSKLYKFSKDGKLWNKHRHGWEISSYNLQDILTSGRLPKIAYDPKSEAELILDELEDVVGKAKAVLERSGR